MPFTRKSYLTVLKTGGVVCLGLFWTMSERNTHFLGHGFLLPLVQEILCKLIGATQSTCVFFSSFSILLIAMDRYLFIVRPTGRQISVKQVTHNLSLGSQFLYIYFFILQSKKYFTSYWVVETEEEKMSLQNALEGAACTLG